MMRTTPSIRPPRLAAWLARLCLHEVDADAVLGDLEETYRTLHRHYGATAARRWYWSQVLRSIPPLAYRTLYWSLVMLKNYVKLALRNLRKQKGYSFINISGLAVGIASCLLLLLYVQDERAYDRFHEHADQIYRVALERRAPEATHLRAVTPFPLAEALRTEYPEVIAATTFVKRTSVWVRQGDQTFKTKHVAIADSNFFEVFSFPLLRGNPKTALARPGSVVLTQATAQRLFDEADPLDQTVTVVASGTTYRVTGVVANVPANAHFQFDVLVSFDGAPTSWLSFGAYTYLRLADGHAPEALQAKFPAMTRKYATPQVEDQFGKSFDAYLAEGNGYRYFLQPLTRIHLHSKLQREIEPNGNVLYVYLLSTIAVLILVLACINFTNLTTARAVRRAREVGVRKVLGSRRTQLIGQFLFESTLMTVTALALALVLITFILPAFNHLTGKALTVNLFATGWMGGGLLGLALLISLLSGGYPAIILSAFRPIAVLSGSFGGARRGGVSVVRNGLVVFQFAVSIVLMVATVVVYQQLHFIQTKDLGLDQEQVVVLDHTDVLGPQQEAFKQALLDHTNVRDVSAASSVPGRGHAIRTFVPEDDASDTQHLMYLMSGDYESVPTLGLSLAAGRNFSHDFATDSTALLINEAAARQLGWADPVGQRLRYGRIPYTVVGVLKDFHFLSLHQEVQPFVLRLGGSGHLAVRLDLDKTATTLAVLEKTWQAFVPDQPFEYTFLDEDFAALYQSEQATSRILSTFAALALLIACLGLFGLATYAAEQRTKEIGVRKVVGASVGSIVLLLSTAFTRLVLLAFVVAVPVAYFAMRRWLEDFAYRIDLSWPVFLLAGLAALGIALLTVSYQAIKAALADPVDSLRYE